MSDADVILTPSRRGFLAEARRAVLVTRGSGGRVRPVPVCFAVAPPPSNVLWTPVDQKPKRSADARMLARVRDILAWPAVAILVDRWEEDWSRLGWLRLEGEASLLDADAAADSGPAAGDEASAGDGTPGHDRREHETAVLALRARYPQYASHALERLPIIRIAVTRAAEWTAEGG